MRKVTLICFSISFFTLPIFAQTSVSRHNAPVASGNETQVIEYIIDDSKVNDDTGTADNRVPAIAMDGSGKFIITWWDGRNGDEDIFLQRYNSAGTPQGSNVKVNDDAGTARQIRPTIAMDGSGNFVITWEDYRNVCPEIYFQRYNSAGTPQGFNIKQITDGGLALRACPFIAIDGSGNFVITWLDSRISNWNLYFQRYNSAGTPQGSNVKVDNDAGPSGTYSPGIAMDGSGNFVITWHDYRHGGGHAEIYLQRYNSAGTPQGSNIQVNDDAGMVNQWDPAIAMDGSGNFVITWTDFRNVNPEIYFQRYNSVGTPQGSNFKVNDDTGSVNQGDPAIAMDGSGNFVITWTDYRNGNADIYAQMYNSSGAPFGSNFKIDHATTGDQQLSAVAANSSNIYYTWEDFRNGNWDIYANVVDLAVCGDANADGSVTVSDVIYFINYLFKGGPAPQCPHAPYLSCADANGDGSITVSDVVYLVNYLFKGGPPPAC